MLPYPPSLSANALNTANTIPSRPQTLTALLEALAALGAPPPPPLAAALVARLETALGRLPAPALAAALTAVQRLGLGGDGQLMGGYLDRWVCLWGDVGPACHWSVLCCCWPLSAPFRLQCREGTYLHHSAPLCGGHTFRARRL